MTAVAAQGQAMRSEIIKTAVFRVQIERVLRQMRNIIDQHYYFYSCPSSQNAHQAN